jgi:hypothetical protein
MTTAAQTESLSTEGVRSLEVRWIFSGELAGVVNGWFARFPTQTTVLEDAYLLDPHLPGLSVKVREGRALEVKAYRGSPGRFEVAGRARGRLESWQKWSFPHGPAGRGGGGSAGWRAVSKRRRISRFSLAGGPAKAGDRGEDEGPGVCGGTYRCPRGWRGLVDSGVRGNRPPGCSAQRTRGCRRARFATALPGGLELDMDDSRSYGHWLQRAAAGTGIEPKPEGDPLADVGNGPTPCS